MTDYHTFSKDDAAAFADKHSDLFGEHSKLNCEQFSDSLMNLVFRVSNDKGTSLIVKQALPYVRSIGESWPLTTDRTRIEAQVLMHHYKICPEHTVEVLHYDIEQAALLQQDLKNYRILRNELIAGKQFPHLAGQMAKYLATTLFYSSDFALTGPNKKNMLARFLNPELGLVTEDLFFTDPYCNHERNDIYTGIMTDAQQLWHDEALQAEIAALKADFLSKPQALLHGDLHSSSIFINDDNCKVFDAEFGGFGPIGFDVGTLLGSLLINYLAHFGLTAEVDRQDYQQYLLQQTEQLWQQFAAQFTQLMAHDCHDPMLSSSLYQQRFMQQVLADALGYAGCEIIRRTVGLIHAADFEQIEDSAPQAESGRMALKLGRELIMQRRGLATIGQVLTLVRYLPTMDR